MSDDLVWEAPGPGDWWFVPEHFPYAVTRMFGELFPPVSEGWRTGGARYGLPTGAPQWGLVNNRIYYGPPIPLTADEMAERERIATTPLELGTETHARTRTRVPSSPPPSNWAPKRAPGRARGCPVHHPDRIGQEASAASISAAAATTAAA